MMDDALKMIQNAVARVEARKSIPRHPLCGCPLTSPGCPIISHRLADFLAVRTDWNKARAHVLLLDKNGEDASLDYVMRTYPEFWTWYRESFDDV